MNKKAISGIILFEILIAMSIVSFVLCALFFYQMDNLKRVQIAYFRSMASIQLSNFSEMLRENTTEISRVQAYAVWSRYNKILLPQSESSWIQHGINDCELVVHWLYRYQQSMFLRVFC